MEEGMPPTEFTFAQCESCHYAALFVRGNIGDGFENDSYYRVYPAHSRHIGFALPAIVRESYEEAVKCENIKAYLAQVVMVRRALEAVVREYDPNARTLHAGLKAMSTNGLVSQELADWSNQLRVIGNQGAHPTKETVGSIDAVEALDFLQAMLEILYDLRPKFEIMQKRRANTANP
jgi:hypothetical protein